MPVTAGHDQRVSYVWEDDSSGNPNFAGTPTDTDNKPFGSDASASTLEGSNNAVRAFNPNSREAREIIERQFRGSWSVSFTLTNPWWLRGALHNGVATSGTAAPYSHSFDGDVPYSMQIVVGNEATGDERTLKGCVVASASISISTGGAVEVSLDGAYADEVIGTPASLAAQPSINERPMHFAQATVQRPSGTTLSLVQEVTLSIENNIDLVGELGTRFAVDYSPKVRAVDIQYGDIVEDSTETKRMYGDSAATSPQEKVTNQTTIDVVVDNGETGSAKNSLTFSLTGAAPDTYGRSGTGDPEADVEGQLNELVAGVSATAENDNSAAR